MTAQSNHDSIVRAMTADDECRAVAIDSTSMVSRAIETQSVAGDLARLYGQLLSGAVLIRETTAPKMRVQAILKRAGAGSMIADAHPDGRTRGLVNPRGASTVELGADTHLQIIRQLPNDQLHKGVVATTADGGLSASLTTYMMRSEQVETAINVGCLIDGDTLVAAGGFLIQPMPDASMNTLAAITGRLVRLDDIDPWLAEGQVDPTELLDNVLGPIGFDVLEQNEVHFGCNCSTQHFLDSLATLGRRELEKLAADDEPLEITCDYCTANYALDPARIRALLDGASTPWRRQ